MNLRKVFYIASILMLAVLTMGIASASPVQLVEKKVISSGGNFYGSERYSTQAVASPYGGNVEFLIMYKCSNSACSNQPYPRNITYLFPGDNLKGNYSFAYPFDASIAKRILDGRMDLIYQGNVPPRFYLEFQNDVGIVIVDKTRSTDVPAELSDYSFMKSWDMVNYTNDFQQIFDFVNSTVRPKKVLGIGHSRGSEVLQMFSDRENLKIGKVPYRYLGMVSVDMVGEYRLSSQPYNYALVTLRALKDYINAGNYSADSSFLAAMIDLAQYSPNDPSPVPGFEGLTNIEALYFVLENTGSLPGPLTPVTGLPDNWPMGKFATGNLTHLNHTNIQTVFGIRNKGGFYPIVPLALEKQGLEKRTHGGGLGGNGVRINFTSWTYIFYSSIMAGQGFGIYPDTYTVQILMGRGDLKIVPDFGHADILELK